MAWLSCGTVEEQKLCPGIRSRVLERIVKNFKNHKQVFERALIKFNRRRCFSSLVKTFDYSAMGSTSAVVAIIIVMFFHPPWSIGQPSDFVQIRTDSFGKQTVRDVRARRTRASLCTVIVGACFTTTKLWSRMRPGLLGTDQNGTDRQIDSCSGRNDWGVVGVYMEQHLHPERQAATPLDPESSPSLSSLYQLLLAVFAQTIFTYTYRSWTRKLPTTLRVCLTIFISAYTLDHFLRNFNFFNTTCNIYTSKSGYKILFHSRRKKVSKNDLSEIIGLVRMVLEMSPKIDKPKLTRKILWHGK